MFSFELAIPTLIVSRCEVQRRGDLKLEGPCGEHALSTSYDTSNEAIPLALAAHIKEVLLVIGL